MTSQKSKHPSFITWRVDWINAWHTSI